MNQFTVMGNLCRDPETRHISDTASVTSFSIAVNRKWKDASGAAKEAVTFIDVKAWNKTGEIIQQYFTKGKPILLVGRIEQENWEDKESGAKRSKLVLNANEFHFCGGDKPAQSEPESRPSSTPFAKRTTGQTQAAPAIPEIDIPF